MCLGCKIPVTGIKKNIAHKAPAFFHVRFATFLLGIRCTHHVRIYIFNPQRLDAELNRLRFGLMVVRLVSHNVYLRVYNIKINLYLYVVYIDIGHVALSSSVWMSRVAAVWLLITFQSKVLAPGGQ